MSRLELESRAREQELESWQRTVEKKERQVIAAARDTAAWHAELQVGGAAHAGVRQRAEGAKGEREAPEKVIAERA